MSIRLLAIELYRTQQNVARIEAQLAVEPVSTIDVLREEFRYAQAELQQLRKMLDDKKTSSSLRVPSVYVRSR